MLYRSATILITVCQYGIPNAGPWLLDFMEVIFWIYVGASTAISAGLYLTLWSTQYVPQRPAYRASVDNQNTESFQFTP